MVMEIGEKFKLIVIFNKHAPNDQGKLSIFLICLLAINVLCRNVCWNLGIFEVDIFIVLCRRVLWFLDMCWICIFH